MNAKINNLDMITVERSHLLNIKMFSRIKHFLWKWYQRDSQHTQYSWKCTQVMAFPLFKWPKKLRHAVIPFSINYWNVLVSGFPALLSIKLIKNSAARKGMWASKYDYIISVSFHWSIVNAHTDYKVLFLKALHSFTTQ